MTMNKHILAITGILILPAVAWSDQSMYCPQKSGYINTGMSQAQVINACGQPASKQESDAPIMQKVPMQQVIYNNMGQKTAFYGVWQIPIGQTNPPNPQPFGNNNGGGAQMQVNIVNNKVYSVSLNGGDTNAVSICGGRNIQAGDPAGVVYGACGAPSLVNQTFINEPIQSPKPPEIWIYKPGPYQPAFRLTFINGKLQSIN